MTTQELAAIASRVKRGYIFDRPGEVVVVPEDDTLALLAEVARLKGALRHIEHHCFPCSDGHCQYLGGVARKALGGSDAAV